MHWNKTNTAYILFNGAFSRPSHRGERTDDFPAMLRLERARASIEAQRRWNA